MEILWLTASKLIYILLLYSTSCPFSPDHLDHLFATLFILLSILYLSMQDLILEDDFDVNFSLLSSLLDKMKLISDLYLFSLNQIVPSPTHFSQTSVPSIIDIVFVPSTHSSRCAQAKPLLLIEILTNLIYFPSDIIHPSINSYPALSPLPSLQHQNYLLFHLCCAILLHSPCHRTVEFSSTPH